LNVCFIDGFVLFFLDVAPKLGTELVFATECEGVVDGVLHRPQLIQREAIIVGSHANGRRIGGHLINDGLIDCLRRHGLGPRHMPRPVRNDHLKENLAQTKTQQTI